MKALIATDLSKSFGAVQAVSGLSFSVQPGEIFGLIGPDAAGKTTTIRMLVGVMDPDAGNVEIGGRSMQKQPDACRESIGYMPQAYGLYADLTAEENLRFFAELLGLVKSSIGSRVTELLQFVRLSPFAKRRAGDLSGGMYKKLAVACAMIHSPRILILDEPTNGVDPVSRRELWALLFELSHSGVAIIASTPYMDEAERFHRITLMHTGKPMRSGSPASMMNELDGRVFELEADIYHDALSRLRDKFNGYIIYGNGRTIRLVAPDSASAARKLGKLQAESYVKSIRPSNASFEDVFMVELA